MTKPADVFDRDVEWAQLESFVSSPHPGSTLGLVYGRRRQGKTYLLEAMVEAFGGLYVSARQQSEAQNLQQISARYQAFVGTRAPVRFATWDEALMALLAVGDDARRPVPVVIDEFPYLLADSPELPSILQSHLSPRSAAMRSWRTRLVLCGSALTTMRALLSGTAALRGRASLELMIHPFGYREAASFWDVEHDLDLAVRLHALVGGTPAYRDMAGGTGPSSGRRFDDWVLRTLLNPASALFREGNVLLSEEPNIVDVAPYLAVLTAVSQGRTRRGEIAAALGRGEGTIAHTLTVLTEARLIESIDDACKLRRSTFHVAEPILRTHQLVVAPHLRRLERQQGAAVWAEVADTVSAQIYGPHFESLARTWCAEHASVETLGGVASKVGPTTVACPLHRVSHQVDVAVVSIEPSRRTLALGEVKWRSTAIDMRELVHLEHLRELIGAAPDAKLLLCSRRGFVAELQREARRRDDIELVDLERLYHGD